jgi:hypothetical protein
VIATYEPEIYPGVKICYSWNEDYQDRNQYREGRCYCTERCTGKGKKDSVARGNGNCKIITICVFQSGKIIITGGKSLKQTHDAYYFINRVLKNHYETIAFVEPVFEKEGASPSGLTASAVVTKKIEKKKIVIVKKKSEVVCIPKCRIVDISEVVESTFLSP